VIDLTEHLTPTQLAIVLQPAFVIGFFAFVGLCHWLVGKLPKSKLRDALLKQRGTGNGRKLRGQNPGSAARQHQRVTRRPTNSPR
jgi:hypothetical protein